MTELVVLPGLDGTGLLLEDFAASSTADFDCTVIAYPPDRFLDYPRLADFVQPLLPRERPFFLVAESFSGPVAALLAAKAIPNLRGVIFVCSFLSNPRPELAASRPLISMLPIKSLPVSVIAIPTLGNWSSEELREKIRQALMPLTNDVQRERLRAIVDTDVSDAARTIDTPVLYLQAAQDFLVPATTAERIRQCIPHMRIVEIQGPHFLLQTQTAECRQAIKHFIQSLE